MNNTRSQLREREREREREKHVLQYVECFLSLGKIVFARMCL